MTYSVVIVTGSMVVKTYVVRWGQLLERLFCITVYIFIVKLWQKCTVGLIRNVKAFPTRKPLVACCRAGDGNASGPLSGGSHRWVSSGPPMVTLPRRTRWQSDSGSPAVNDSGMPSSGRLVIACRDHLKYPRISHMKPTKNYF